MHLGGNINSHIANRPALSCSDRLILVLLLSSFSIHSSFLEPRQNVATHHEVVARHLLPHLHAPIQNHKQANHMDFRSTDEYPQCGRSGVAQVRGEVRSGTDGGR